MTEDQPNPEAEKQAKKERLFQLYQTLNQETLSEVRGVAPLSTAQADREELIQLIKETGHSLLPTEYLSTGLVDDLTREQLEEWANEPSPISATAKYFLNKKFPNPHT